MAHQRGFRRRQWRRRPGGPAAAGVAFPRRWGGARDLRRPGVVCRGSLLSLTALGCIVAAGTVTVFGEFLHHYPAGSAWPHNFELAGVLAFVAVVALGERYGGGPGPTAPTRDGSEVDN